jgi:hypothetical protein
VFQHIWAPSAYYSAEGATYNPEAVVVGFQRLARGVPVPPITGIASVTSAQAKLRTGLNDGLVNGHSNWPCYEPLFGYRLELAPPLGLAQGPIELPARSDPLNLVDPSTYFARGDHRTWLFSGDDRVQARQFAAYRAYSWQMPAWQAAGTAASAVSFLLSFVLLGGAAYRVVSQRVARTGSSVGPSAGTSSDGR